jgi:hypothetical protein
MYKYWLGFGNFVLWIGLASAFFDRQWVIPIVCCYICVRGIYLPSVDFSSFVVFHLLPFIYIYSTCVWFIFTGCCCPVCKWLLLLLLLCLLLIACWWNRLYILRNTIYVICHCWLLIFVFFKKLLETDPLPTGNTLVRSTFHSVFNCFFWTLDTYLRGAFDCRSTQTRPYATKLK